MTHRTRIVNNFLFPSAFEGVDSAVTYQARPDDVFISTFPKCGTTWTQQIVTLIFNNGVLPPEVEDSCIFAASPFLEAEGKEAAENVKRPAAIKTHMSYSVIPKHPDAKYIIVLRNPKDVIVSYFYHHCSRLEDDEPLWSFDQFFELMFRGENAFGDYFDWVLSWWNHRFELKTLFLLYEDMKTDFDKCVKQIAEFLGSEYYDKLKTDGNLMESIRKQCSIDHMKQTTDKQMGQRGGKSKQEILEPIREFHIVRKGVVGDWRNHMTDEQSRRIDEKFHQKFDGTGVEKLWHRFPELFP